MRSPILIGRLKEIAEADAERGALVTQAAPRLMDLRTGGVRARVTRMRESDESGKNLLQGRSHHMEELDHLVVSILL